MNDVMHRKRACGGFWEFWESQLVELRLDTGQEGSTFRLLAEALGRWCTYWWGGGTWKSQNRMNVYLSPYVEEPLNSKVIKGFVPELRSRKCFSCFEIPMFYVYIYEHYKRFAYRYEYVHFTYSYLAMVHFLKLLWRP